MTGVYGETESTGVDRTVYQVKEAGYFFLLITLFATYSPLEMTGK